MAVDDTSRGGDQEPVLPPSKFGAGYSVGDPATPAPPPSYSPPPSYVPPVPAASPPPVYNVGYSAPSEPPFEGGLSYPQPTAPNPMPAPVYPAAPAPAVAGYQSGYAAVVDPNAPYGRDPASGEPLSDKSAVAAGCLQLFLGYFGVGRFYIGSGAIGGIQLGLWIFGWVTTIVFIGFAILAGVWIWTLIDAIMMFTGSVKDGQGRKLR